jgi:2-phospho-L-lactate guanylyltransferase
MTTTPVLRPAASMWVVVPVKDSRAAKQRLSGCLAPNARQELAQAMAADVLAALADVRGLAGIAIVTTDPFARDLAASIGAHVVTAGAHQGHTAAADAGTVFAIQSGATAVLTLPADVPLVTAAEIEAVIAAHAEGPSFTIVPAHDRLGSNCIVRSPPQSVALDFGVDSFERHLAASRRAGITPHVIEQPGLALDIDNPEDLRALMHAEAAVQSRALLYQLGVDVPRTAGCKR